MTADPHPYWRFDHQGTLRLRFVDWLGLVFLSRHVLFTIVIGIAEGQARAGLGREFGILIEPWFMLADIPALALLLAALNRVPNAGRVARFLWRHGRWAVAASTAIYGAVFWGIAVLPGYDAGILDRFFLALTVLVGVYGFAGRYPRELFASFPSADAS